MDSLVSDPPATRVHFNMEGTTAVVTIDNPPVNAGSHAVRKGLVEAIGAAASQGATGAVLIGAGSCFVAGSDLKEFGKPLEWPELPDVIKTLEDAPFPVVAALHGVALGGGLELALGCDYRVAAQSTKLGLPEISLGFVPGAGGTQRLPRLVGIGKAIDMICGAEQILAAKAREIGLVDALSQDDLKASALAFLESEKRPKRLAKTQSPPPETAEAIETAANRALKKGKNRPNVLEAIRLVKQAADTDADKALADERAVFQKLRVSDEAFALRYLFFAERKAAMIDGLDKKLARSATSVGVVGGGTMGQGIARAFLAAGFPVTLVERDTASIEKALESIAGSLDALVKKGRLSEAESARRKDILEGTTDYADLANCDIAIEAVFEDMAVKKDVMRCLEAAMAQDAIIASNTSYLDIDEMAGSLWHPERVVGLHFFSPADVMPLLEIVRADKTSDAVLASGLKLARKLGKTPVVARVADGFIGNRIYAAYRRRAELLMLDGASPQDIDKAATEFGFAMGPFAVSDLAGLDIAWATRKRKAANRDSRERYVAVPDWLCEAGRFGRKTGKGWYDYSSGKAQPDPIVDAMIASARVEAGVRSHAYTSEAIQRQLLAAIINEAACLLREGVAQRASDVDVALSNGYGFPRWRGGPLYWAARQDRAMLETEFAALAEAVGHGYNAGPVSETLDQIEIAGRD